MRTETISTLHYCIPPWSFYSPSLIPDFSDSFTLPIALLYIHALQHNTFQCVLAYSAQSVTTGSGSESSEPQVSDPMSFVLFLYEDGGMQWSRGVEDSAQHALVGISNGDDR